MTPEIQTVQNSVSTPADSRTETLFILDNLSGWQTLVDAAPQGSTVVIIDSTGDALAQMADYLATLDAASVDAIHLFSHGSSGRLLLGATELSAENLLEEPGLLSLLGSVLSEDGDLLLYGCNVGEGSTGIEFVNHLAQRTGADVAASDDATGSAALGGDWILETQSGPVAVLASDVFADYGSLLAVFDFSGASSGGGSVTQTVSGITLTATTDTNGLSIWNNEAYDTSNSGTYIEFSFSAAIDVTSFKVGFHSNSGGANLFNIAGTDGTTNYTYNVSPGYSDLYGTETPAYTVDLSGGNDWGTVTSIRVTVNDVGTVAFIADDIVFTVPPSEINVSYSGTTIVDGDTTPSSGEGTDFGSVAAASGTIVRTFTIENSGEGPLFMSGSPLVSITGTNAADFSVTTQPDTSVSSGGSTTFNVTFNPSAVGTRTATITIANNDADENPYNFDLQGTGTNTAPMSSNDSRTLLEDSGSTLLTVSDFGSFNDADGSSLVKVQITALESAGVLEYSSDGLSWSDVTLNQEITSADIDAGRLRFTPDADANGTPYATIGFKVSDGTDYSASAYTLTINVSAENDAPTFTAGADLVAVTEDTTAPGGASISSLLNGNFSDIDGDGFAGVVVTADSSDPVNEGTWQYSTDGSTWYAIGTVTTAAGLLLDTTTLLRFLPVADYHGTPGELTVYAVDDSSATTFTVDASRQTYDTTSDGATAKVAEAGVGLGTSITPIGDAPVVTNAATDEDGQTGSGLVVSRNAVDGAEVTHFKITNISGGTLYKNDGTTQISNGDFITFAEGQAGLKFTPTADSASNGSFDVQSATDGVGGGLSASSATATITVNAVNDTPTLTNLNGDAVSYTIDGTAIPLDASGDATLSDVDSSDFNGGNVTVAVVGNPYPSEDVLSVGIVGAISVSGSNVIHSDGFTIGTFSGGSAGSDLVITLNANATVSRVRDLISALQYLDSDSSTTNTAARSVRITVDDGDGGTSLNQDVTVSLVRAPIIDLDGDDSSGAVNGGYTGSFSEDGGAVAAADSDAAISDDGSYKSLTVTLANHPDGVDEILSSSYGSGAQTVNGEAVTIGAYNSGDGTLTITVDAGSASDATMQMLIASIRYDNSSDDPDTADRSITFTATDNDDNVGTAATAVLSVTSVNDAPTLAATGSDPSYIEGAGAADLFHTVTASTVETADRFSAMTLTVTNVSDGAFEVLGFDGSDVALTNGNSVVTATNGLTVTVAVAGSTATVGFSGESLTNAEMQTLVDALSYRNTSDDPTIGSNRVVTITAVKDTGGTANSGQDTAAVNLVSTVALTAVNDAPVISGVNGDSSSIVAGSGAQEVTLFNDATVTNADSADYNGGSLLLTQGSGTTNGSWGVDGTTVTSGGDAMIAAGETIAVGGVAIGIVHATNDGQDGNTLQVNFNANTTSARIQTLLQAVTYSAPSALGARTFALTLNDGDGTANGGDQDAVAGFTIDITPNPPVISNLHGDSVNGIVGKAIQVDSGGDVTVSDADSSNFDTGNLTITRTGGTGNFGLTGSGSTGVSSGISTLDADGTIAASENIYVDGVAIASVSAPSDGQGTHNLIFNFDSNATPARVQTLIRALNFTSTTEGTNTFSLTLKDASSGATSAAGNFEVDLAAPTITSATYSTQTGTFVVTGTDLQAVAGDNNDIDASLFTITGEGGSTYTLTYSVDVEISSATEFSLVLSATDKTEVDALINNSGTASTDHTTYNLAVSAGWNGGGGNADLVDNGITATLNTPPVITSDGGDDSAAIRQTENESHVTTVSATDDDGDTVTYRLDGGADQGRFSIDAASGVLSFISAPDYDNPVDADRDNSYEVIVTADDGKGGSDSQQLTISVVNEAPQITSDGGNSYAVLSVDENPLAVTTIQAHDADNDSITYRISGGIDADQFQIDAASGMLSFIAAPDYENPSDNGGNNNYVVRVTAVDSHGADDVQTLSINVVNVDESGDPVQPGDDGDGTPAADENQAPPVNDDGQTGDGNGDGLADSAQADVASVVFRETDHISTDVDAVQTYITLVADARDGKEDTSDDNQATLYNVAQLDAPDDLPDDLSMPLGLISFTAAVEQVGATETFSLYVDGSLGINSYLKQNADGDWVNLASSVYGGAVIEEGNKVRLDFQITDGSEFDADGEANGIIVDPGAPGYMDSPAVDVIRFYNPSRMLHMYSALDGEIGVLSAEDSGWVVEGPAFKVDADDCCDVYRFFNAFTGDHFFTANEAEAQGLMANEASGYIYEGIAFQVADSGSADDAINRYYKAETGEHFYTDSAEEGVIVTGQLGYVYEGVLGYGA
ncbi:DUF4347 domain-containing protein [uncultured Desulfuromonas sp.]|uniref:DUF4347 domain-containing protein n=1 Tax=uncultured Desulfuromonas sp. TaxID=181013 RepID=UPI002AAA9E29|nr:DUF4347 domain-containing protein [uncultured Desulfuromonas sp.]